MIKNLTPHSINLPDGLTLTPEPISARVSVSQTEVGTHDGVSLVRGTYGEVTGLPDPQPGTLYVVSLMVRQAMPERHDLASPAKLVRDEAGNIIGCCALELS